MTQSVNSVLGRIKTHNKSTYLCAAGIFVTVLIFFAITGTATSGFHFIDDWGMISIHDDLQSHSLASTMVNWLRDDLQWRFRPFYYVHRVLEVFVFGTNFKHLSFYTIALCEITMLVFFFAMKKLGFSNGLSVLFLCLTFLGPQMAVWWRLGPNETIGMLCFSLCFYTSIPKSAEEQQVPFGAVSDSSGTEQSPTEGIEHFARNSALFAIFALLCILSKESFMVCTPAICFMRVAFVRNAAKYTWKKSFRVCLPVIALLLAAMTAALFIILKSIGIHGYGGVDSSLYRVIRGCAWLVLRNGYITMYEVMIAVIVCSDIIVNDSKEKLISLIKGVFPYLIMGALIVCPNIILYSKSSIWERYLLPTSLGFALAICALLSYVRGRDLFFSVFLTIALSFLYIPKNLVPAIEDAIAFRDEGVRVHKFLKTVTDNVGAGDVLYVANPVSYNERSASFKVYMKVMNNTQVYCQLPVDYVITGNDGGIRHMQPRREEMTSDPSVIAGFDVQDVENAIARYYPDGGYVNISEGEWPVFVKK